MLGINTLAKKIFGTPNDRKVKSVQPLVAKINALEPEFQALSDQGIKDKTAEFKKRVENGESLDSLLPEAFANAREAAVRALGLRPFDVQLMGGIFLHQGNISEMKTGEGKTLVATLPAYLNALTGRGVHVVTVNDYLAKRDADWMSKVYNALDMDVGVIFPNMDPQVKALAYAADVTYATNNELGFDYLRDNMKSDLNQMFQRDHHFAIVDEVDSILVDEARTPLIISGPSEDKSDLYTKIDAIIPSLSEEHYDIDEKTRAANLTDEGNDFIEHELRSAGYLEEEASLYDPESASLVHHVQQALRAHKLFTRDKDYIVRNEEVVLIDEFTGRMMSGRRLSDGLHQAIEAREGVAIQPENITLASVTFQNYFRLYDKLGGMTGTAMTEADEFMEIYGLGVVEVPTNVPIARIDNDDQVYRTQQEKYGAIVKAIGISAEKKQPVLVGTTSIEKSEILSNLLKEAGMEHNVLNARFHEQEASIVAQAGRLGAITIATNMAGRGTDIQLGGNVDVQVAEELEKAGEGADEAAIRERVEAEVAASKAAVKEAGGLFVLATERHESRRIDNQLRGRSGRQGDPGRTNFFLSLEDDLMRIFGSDRLDNMLQKLGMKEGEAIIHPWVNKALERAQAKVEARNFDIRKNLLKFDDVMNDQRKAIFGQRREIMEAQDLSEVTRDMRHEVIDDLVAEYVPKRAYSDQWNAEGLYGEVVKYFAVDLPVMAWADEDGVDDEIITERLYEATDKAMAKKATDFGPEAMRQIEKQVLLDTIDERWREHLLTLDHLRSVVGFRGYAQRDPLNEYKTESFGLFEGLLERLRGEVTGKLSHVQMMSAEQQQEMMRQMQELQSAQAQRAAGIEEPEDAIIASKPIEDAPEGNAAPATQSAPAKPATPASAADPDDPSTWHKVGRNGQCPCGSGKKFKQCHGKVG